VDGWLLYNFLVYYPDFGNSIDSTAKIVTWHVPPKNTLKQSVVQQITLLGRWHVVSRTSSGLSVMSYSIWMMENDVRKNFPEENYHLSRCTWLVCVLLYYGNNDATQGPVNNPLVVVGD
jgi:hypothetical protein